MAGGRPNVIESPEDFERLALEYIQWVKDNPVMKTITAAFQGEVSYRKVPHARPMTQYGLAAHMGIGLSTLKDYGKREEFSAMFQRVCVIMTSHNIDGATSGDMSGNIISRIEELADKQQIEQNTVIKDYSNMSLEEAAEEYRKAMG